MWKCFLKELVNISKRKLKNGPNLDICYVVSTTFSWASFKKIHNSRWVQSINGDSAFMESIVWYAILVPWYQYLNVLKNFDNSLFLPWKNTYFPRFILTYTIAIVHLPFSISTNRKVLLQSRQEGSYLCFPVQDTIRIRKRD